MHDAELQVKETTHCEIAINSIELNSSQPDEARERRFVGIYITLLVYTRTLAKDEMFPAQYPRGIL